MFALTPRHRFYLYQESCDMRKRFNGLSGLVRNETAADPLSGDAFVFINRSRTTMKLLVFEGDGYLLYHKRLAAGSFQKQTDNIFFLIPPFFLFSQNPNFPNKHDYIWLIGYGNNPTPNYNGDMRLDFNGDTLVITDDFKYADFDITNNTMSNESGELIYYYEGEAIYNSANEIMENGEDINLDTMYQTFNTQSAISLPHPDGSNRYFLFHKEQTWVAFDGESLDGAFTGNFKLFYTLIDMDLNDGLGSVVDKNIMLLNDTLDKGRMTATRHANGRDWWFLIPEYWSNKYYTFTLGLEGVVEYPKQEVGEVGYTGVGSAAFSPDGSRYINIASRDLEVDSIYVDIFDFDRCTGEMSNQIRIEYPLEVPSASKPIAISPNSRYLYVMINSWYYQYDLYAEDIEASEIKLEYYDQ